MEYINDDSLIGPILKSNSFSSVNFNDTKEDQMINNCYEGDLVFSQYYSRLIKHNRFDSENKKDRYFIIEIEDSFKYDTKDLLIIAREHMENNDMIALNLYEVNSRTMYTVQKIEMGYSIFNSLNL